MKIWSIYYLINIQNEEEMVGKLNLVRGFYSGGVLEYSCLLGVNCFCKFFM